MSSISKGKLGCENCRSRRIKCNQLRPRCSQCARAGLQCSGYRTPLDLLFQDQTMTITRKYRKPNTDLTLPKEYHTSVTSFVPRTPVEKIAWQYYFEHFNIARAAHSLKHQSLPNASSTAIMSVASVGLAALAATHRDPHLMHLARHKYALTLRLLAHALQDPAQVSETSTAISCFNLSMFEMIVYDTRSSSHDWVKHINGTMVVLQSRTVLDAGASQMASVLQVCYTIVVACIISKQTCPAFTIALVESIAGSDSVSYLRSPVKLFPILCALVDLYVQTYQKENQKRSQTISTAIKIDQSLLSWASHLPSCWVDPLERKISSQEMDECLVARVWVYYRLCRVLAHSIILSSLAHPLQSIYSATGGISWVRRDESSALISQMSSEIYALIPSMLGLSNTPSQSTPALSSNVFFLITILQAMVELTDKQSVIDEWSLQTSQLYGEEFAVTRDLVLRRLC